MGMRLLLLRSPSSRTREENDLVGILEGSFKAYAKDNKRSRSELARLLVTEYMCLTSTTSDSDSCSMPNSSPQLLHQEQPKLPPMLKEEPVAVPTKVYSSTQLAIPRATLPPMTFGRTSSSSAMSRPPTRLPSVLSMSSMRSRGRVVSLTGGTSGCYPSDQGFIDQAPSFWTQLYFSLTRLSRPDPLHNNLEGDVGLFLLRGVCDPTLFIFWVPHIFAHLSGDL